MGHGKNSKGEFKSQVPHVMLHLNPGVARHYGSQVRALDKLKNKVVILNCLILSIQIHILCVIKNYRSTSKFFLTKKNLCISLLLTYDK